MAKSLAYLRLSRINDMPMVRTTRRFFRVISLLTALVCASEASARVDVHLKVRFDSHDEIQRWNTVTGAMVLEYQPNVPPGWGSWAETIDSIAMDGMNRVHAAGNNIGTISVVQFNTATGLQTGAYPNFLGGPVGDMEFGVDGELYVAGSNGGIGPNAAVLRRFPAVDQNANGERTLKDSDYVRSMVTSADGQSLYVLQQFSSTALTTRVSSYSLSELFPAGDPAPLAPAVESNSFLVGPDAYDMTLGPDGLLYLSDFASDKVLRYTTDGDFVDTFINFSADELEFIDGRLLALSDGNVVEINPQTGAFIDTLIGANPGGTSPFRFVEMEAFSLVPEPSSLALSLFFMAVLRGRRAGCEQHVDA